LKHCRPTADWAWPEGAAAPAVQAASIMQAAAAAESKRRMSILISFDPPLYAELR
jgi:hypothetical protein